jgi:hypothetical protein
MRFVEPNSNTTLSPLKTAKAPDGTLLTIFDLPSAQNTRWVARRKALIVVAVLGGLITKEEACSRYAMPPEELLGWESAFRRYGTEGLRVAARRKQMGSKKRPSKVRKIQSVCSIGNLQAGRHRGRTFQSKRPIQQSW